MKQRNLILQSAIALAFGAGATSAVAGDIGTVATVYANEANPGTVAITGPNVNYQWGATINPNTDIQLKLALGDGATWVLTPAATQMTCTDANLGGLVALTSTKSADNTTITFDLNTGANGLAATTSTCIFAPAPGEMKAPSLNTAGGVVNATWRNFATASGVEVDAAGTHSAVVASSAAAITGKIVASSAFTPAAAAPTRETAVIDLVNANSIKFTTPGAALSNVNSPVAINLGSVTFTNTPGLQDDGTGLDYTLAAKTVGFKGTVTGTFQAGSKSDVNGTANCVGPQLALGVLDGTATAFTYTGAAPFATGVPGYICYVVDGIAQIPTTTPQADFKTTPGLATDLPDQATGALYALVTNGATVDIATYVPAGNTAGGYLQFIRIINVGNRATDVVATIINQDGTFGPTGTIIAALPVGGARTVTSNDIELIIGTVPVTDRPRLRLFGSTSFIDAQSFMSNPGGVVTNNSGIERSGPPLAP